MGWRAFVVLVLLALLAVFVAINWSAFVEPTNIKLVAGELDAPLGLIMLGVVILLTALFLLFALSIRTRSVVEGRRLLRELEAARKLADTAEESRFVELQGMMVSEFEALRATVSERSADIQTDVKSSTNLLAAHLGQIDGFLKTSKEEGEGALASGFTVDDNMSDSEDKG